MAIGRRPPATAAAVPPDEPPGVRCRFHGFLVVPCNWVDVQLMPPNSGAVVCAASTAPRSAQTAHGRVVHLGDAVLEDHGCFRVGPALDPLELFHPKGNTTEGQRHIRHQGSLSCPVEVRVAEGVEGRALDGIDAGIEGLERRYLLGTERIDQAAGISQPRQTHRRGEYRLASRRADSLPPMKMADLTTPALVVDGAGLEANLRTMSEALPGARLRPHVKAHKCTALAGHQATQGHRGFTCATILEMEGMARAGLGHDLLLANEVVDATRLGDLSRSGARITLAVDSEETIAAAAAAHGYPKCSST